MRISALTGARTCEAVCATTQQRCWPRLGESDTSAHVAASPTIGVPTGVSATARLNAARASRLPVSAHT